MEKEGKLFMTLRKINREEEEKENNERQQNNKYGFINVRKPINIIITWGVDVGGSS